MYSDISFVQDEESETFDFFAICQKSGGHKLNQKQLSTKVVNGNL